VALMVDGVQFVEFCCVAAHEIDTEGT
jgi:hypothetical protein